MPITSCRRCLNETRQLFRLVRSATSVRHCLLRSTRAASHGQALPTRPRSFRSSLAATASSKKAKIAIRLLARIRRAAIRRPANSEAELNAIRATRFAVLLRARLRVRELFVDQLSIPHATSKKFALDRLPNALLMNTPKMVRLCFCG